MPQKNTLLLNLTICLAATIIIIAPLMLSGKTAISIMILELLGLALLGFVGITKKNKDSLSKPIILFIAVGIMALLLYVIPLPENLWLALPGRIQYINIVSWIENTSDINVYKSLSLVPLNSASVLLSCIPALAIFLVAASFPEQKLKLLIYALLLSATLQACIGLMQYLTHDPLYYFGIRSVQGTQGTFLNRNHFTAFMEMVEPLALAMMIYALIETGKNRWVKFTKVSVFAIISLLLTFMAYTTTSRMGTALLVLSIVLSFWVMTVPGIGKRVVAYIASLRIALLCIIVIAHFAIIKTTVVVVNRMEPERVLGNLRWDMFHAAWNGIKHFFPFGSGPGTMPQIAPAFLPKDNTLFQTTFMNHVHNDYLELLFETGLIGLVIIIVFMALYIIQWRHINHARHSFMILLQSGAGIGILLFLIFSLTDFNLHTPANALTLSFLCGVFFRKTDVSSGINKDKIQLKSLKNQSNA